MGMVWTRSLFVAGGCEVNVEEMRTSDDGQIAFAVRFRTGYGETESIPMISVLESFW